MSAPALAVGGLFVEVRAAGEAQAQARVEEAFDRAGAATNAEADVAATADRGTAANAPPRERCWRIAHVLPPTGGGDPTYGVEVLAPQKVRTSPSDAWELAHAVSAVLGGRAEPWFDDDVRPRAVGGLIEETAFLDGGDPAPNDVRWHLVQMRVPAAHEALIKDGLGLGAGVRIGHPDTGYTEHPEIWGPVGNPLNPIDLEGAANLLEGQPPIDPGTGAHAWHGTATASVMVARPSVSVPREDTSAAVDLLGVAPEARVIPFRVTQNVVLLGWQRRLADAIEQAVKAKCDVVSISLGGLGGIRLERAIRFAEQEGTIVVAAAGNYWPFVVAPATHPLVVACAASAPDGRPWPWTARGSAVDVTAPGHRVWAARWKDAKAVAYAGSGTSFSAAAVAGAAALWLCAHRQALSQRPRAQWPALFRRAVARTAEAVDTLPARGFGAGLLRCDLLVARSIASLDEGVAVTEATASGGADAAAWLVRGARVGAPGLRSQDRRELLPFPVVMMPWYPKHALRALSIVQHEIGHDVDDDLRITAEIEAALEQGRATALAALTPELLSSVAQRWIVYEQEDPFLFASYWDAHAVGGRIHTSNHGWGLDLKRAPSVDYVWSSGAPVAGRTYRWYLDALVALRKRAMRLSSSD